MKLMRELVATTEIEVPPVTVPTIAAAVGFITIPQSFASN